MNLKSISIVFSAIVVIACTSNNAEDVLAPKVKNPIDSLPIDSVPIVNKDTVPKVVSLSTHILPIFSKYSCTSGSCHGGSSSAGGVFLGSHNGISIVAKNGQLYSAISHSGGASPMPSRFQKMTDLELATVKKWIDNGALNN